MIIIINFTMFIMIKPTKVLRYTVDFLFYLFGKGKNDDSDYSCCIKLHIRVTTTKRTVLMILHPPCPIFSTQYIPTSLQIYLLFTLLPKIIYAVFFLFWKTREFVTRNLWKLLGFPCMHNHKVDGTKQHWPQPSFCMTSRETRNGGKFFIIMYPKILHVRVVYEHAQSHHYHQLSPWSSSSS